MQAARQEFETLRKVAPADPRVPLALGLTSLQAKNYDEAEQYAAKLIAAGVPVQMRRLPGAKGRLVQAGHPSFDQVVQNVSQFVADPA